MVVANDTIAAIATPAGKGGIGIIRVSGPLVATIADGVTGGLPAPRSATVRDFVDAEGETIDRGILLFFPGPDSFTGEDVLELHGHGGPLVCDLLLERVVALGARIARPGEFSERAFLNDKIDLAQAEAIADLIDSATREAARGAVRSLDGVFSKRIHELVEALTNLRVLVEAGIDFPEEEIDLLEEEQVGERCAELGHRVSALLEDAGQGALLREGIKVVLAGKPNSGKSTLMNLLAGRETAIVTPVPGTTRDLLHESIHLDGMPLRLVDTAGLRTSADEVEREGIRRAWREIEDADQVLLLVDASASSEVAPAQIFPEFVERLSSLANLVVVRNKIDLLAEPVQPVRDAAYPVLDISAKRGDGVERLLDHLKAAVNYRPASEGQFIARRRHLEALKVALSHLEGAEKLCGSEREIELVAEELRLAQRALAEITGEVTTEELLGRIFSEFCIGK